MATGYRSALQSPLQSLIRGREATLCGNRVKPPSCQRLMRSHRPCGYTAINLMAQGVRRFCHEHFAYDCRLAARPAVF